MCESFERTFFNFISNYICNQVETLISFLNISYVYSSEKDGCCCTIVDTQNKRPTLVCIVYLVIYEQFMFNQVQFLRKIF